MIKKFLTMLLASAIILSFSACSLAVPDDDNVGGNNLPAFGTDKMVGFFAVIYDGEGNPLTSTDFESDDAVKYYREQVKFDDGTGDYYIAFTSGADVLGNVRLRHTSGADEGLEIDVDLNFTYELEGSVMYLYGVYFDEENWSYYVNAELTVVALSSMSGSEISQNLRATANMDDDEEQTITYTCSVNIDLIYTDYLTKVNIFEFDAGNNVIKSSTRQRGENYQAGENCQYVIVEQVFADKNGERYSKRSLVDRSQEDDEERTINLFYANGDGFTAEDALKIDFS